MSYAKKKMAMQIDEKSLAYPFFPQMAGDPGDRKDMDLVMNSKCFHLRFEIVSIVWDFGWSHVDGFFGSISLKMFEMYEILSDENNKRQIICRQDLRLFTKSLWKLLYCVYCVPYTHLMLKCILIDL